MHASGTIDVNSPIGMATYYTSSSVYGICQFPVTMRTSPTIFSASGTNFFAMVANGGSDGFDSLFLNETTTTLANFGVTSNVSGTAGQAGWVWVNNASSFLGFNAEL
jgi:hypothetical protein